MPRVLLLYILLLYLYANVANKTYVKSVNLIVSQDL